MIKATPKIVIATRGSALALAQAHKVKAMCEARMPGWIFELSIIRTTGDKLQTASLANPDKSLPKGLFTKEIEEALLNGSAHLAVHSLKDLPTELPAGLKLGAVPERKDVRDLLITREPLGDPSEFWQKIPPGCTIASSSLRRKSQILQKRPDLNIIEIRGNVGTRLNKVAGDSSMFGTVLAMAGIERLGMTIAQDGTLTGPDVPSGLYASAFPLADMLPCVGQAALGLEVRDDDPLADELCVALNCGFSWHEVHAERAYLRELGGGCQSPIAAYAKYENGVVTLQGMADFDGNVIRHTVTGSLEDCENIGARLASMTRDSANQ